MISMYADSKPLDRPVQTLGSRILRGQVTHFSRGLGHEFCEVERDGIGLQCARNGFMVIFWSSPRRDGLMPRRPYRAAQADLKRLGPCSTFSARVGSTVERMCHESIFDL
jgi:hypothetical protein